MSAVADIKLRYYSFVIPTFPCLSTIVDIEVSSHNQQKLIMAIFFIVPA